MSMVQSTLTCHTYCDKRQLYNGHLQVPLTLAAVPESFHYLFQIPMNPIAFVIGLRNDVNSISFMAYLPTLCEVLVRSTSGPEIFYSYNKRGKKGVTTYLRNHNYDFG